MSASDVAGPSVVGVDEPLSAQTLREQAQTYAAVAETESDLNSNTFVLFRFGGERFAIALDDLDEFAICTVAAAAYRWTGSTPSSISTRGFFSCARPRPRVPQFDAPVSPSMPAPPCHCSAFPGYGAAMSTIFESSRVVDALRPLIVPALQRGTHPAHDPQSAIATSPNHGSQR